MAAGVEDIKRLSGQEMLNMTLLALNLSGYHNGVAQKHREVSKQLFPGYEISSITGNHWNGVRLPKGSFVPNAFKTFRFKTANKSLDSTGYYFDIVADNTNDILILTEGQHIDLVGDANADTITVNFTPDRNLDFNGLRIDDDDDPGRTNKIINIAGIETDRMDIHDGDLDLTDSTIRFDGLVDIKDALIIRHSGLFNDDLIVSLLDMTKVPVIGTGTRFDLDSSLKLVGDIHGGDLNVDGLVNGIDIVNHHARHELGGADVVDVSVWKGVSKGQNAGFFQDQTISKENAVEGEILRFDGDPTDPFYRPGAGSGLLGLTHIDLLGLWNERKVIGKRITDNLEFLARNSSLTYAKGFFSGDDVETPPGNWIPMHGSWELFDEKEMYARYIKRDAYTRYDEAFRGTCYDGRFVYFCPYGSRYFVRYDTNYGFDQTASYEQMRATRVQIDATAGTSWFGCVFDGQYIYYVPSFNNTVVRYRIGHPFNDTTSWETVDVSLVGGGFEDVQFAGACFDGQYIYFVPLTSSEGLRLDTSRDFQKTSGDDTAWIHGGPGPGYLGGTYDGQYVYFAPYTAHDFVRFEPGHYNDATNWQIIDTTSVLNFDMDNTRWDDQIAAIDEKFSGACFDGQYVYFAPYDATRFVRVDTLSAFNTIDSWETVRMSTVLGDRSGTWTPEWNQGGFGFFFTCRFDGRYVYYCPNNSPFMLQFDTEANFNQALSWDKLVFKLGDGSHYLNYYSNMTHRFVDEADPSPTKGTNRWLGHHAGSVLTRSGAQYSHGLWEQENPNTFSANTLKSLNNGNPIDTTFTGGIIMSAAIDRGGSYIWVWATELADVHWKWMVYKVNLDGIVLARRKIGRGAANSFATGKTDVDHVFGRVFFIQGQTGSQIGNAGLYRLRFSSDEPYAYLPPHMEGDQTRTAPLLRIVKVANSGSTPGLFINTATQPRCFHRWIGKWESGMVGYISAGSGEGLSNSISRYNWWIVNEDGSLTFKKTINCHAFPLASDYENSFHGGIDIDTNGFIYGVDSQSGNTYRGSYFVWDTTNFNADMIKVGTGPTGMWPKLIRFSGHPTNEIAAFDITVNEQGLAKAYGSFGGVATRNFGSSNKLVVTLDRDQTWLYSNLWDTPASQGRVSLDFLQGEIHDGFFEISEFGGCETDGEWLTFIPSDGRWGMKFRKPWKIDIKVKFGWRSGP